MNNDSFIGVFIGIMLSIVLLYLVTGFICGVFCNNNRNNIDDNNRDNDNNTTNALDSTIVNNRRIYCVPTNITRKTSNIITIVVINDNEVDDNDSMDNLPIAKLVVN